MLLPKVSLLSAVLPKQYYNNIANGYSSLYLNQKHPDRHITKQYILKALSLVCATFVVLSFFSIKPPTFLENIAIAKRISRQAYLAITPSYEQYVKETTQQTPVPEYALSLASSKEQALRYPLTVPAYPRKPELGPSVPEEDELLFAVATNADRAIAQIRYIWPHFIRSSPLFVLLPPKEADRAEEVAKECNLRGIHRVYVKASDLSVYQQRVLSLPVEVNEDAAPRLAVAGSTLKWLVLGDDDTFWIDKRSLQRMLGKYDPEQEEFIAATSERKESIGVFGRMTFGGAGMALSFKMVQHYVEVYPVCREKWSHTFGGDEAVNRCVGYAKNIDRVWVYHNEPGMHQFDIMGQASGFIESGRPMLTFHHFFSWAKIMPEWMHANDDYRFLAVLMKASNFLSGDNMFRRYSLDGGKTILVNGYSITNYLEPLGASDLESMEVTWGFGPDRDLIYDKQRTPIQELDHEKPTIPEGWQISHPTNLKSPYFLEDVVDINDAQGTATFVYRNEREKRIFIYWNEQ